jgi:hypothetical protein
MQETLRVLLLGYGLNIVIAVLILIGGWILALLISSAIRAALARTSLDNTLATNLGVKPTVNIEGIVSRIVFWVVMLFVIIAVFNFLNLPAVSGPFNRLLEEVFAFIPNLFGAVVLGLVAWGLAYVLWYLTSKALRMTSLDDIMTQQVGLTQEGRPPMSETLANIVYWGILLLFLPAILGALNLQGLLSPVQDMVDEILGALPNILKAALIFIIGWFVARIVRQIVTSFLVAIGADSLGQRVGLSGATDGQSLSNIIGTIVHTFIIIVVLISALDALQIEAISAPATNMLNTLLEAIPAIFGAMIILGFTYFIAQLVSGLVTNLLTTVGFDRVLGLIGIGSEPGEGQRTPSQVVGYLVLIGLMLFAIIQAAELLGFEIVAVLVAAFLTFAGQIILGIIVLGIGLYLANLAAGLIRNTAGPQAKLLAQVARLAIIVLTTAMGLRQMGIAEDIVNTAFTLLLGAIAVAVALAFGLGSRESAGREVENVLNKIRSDDDIVVP